MISGGHTVRLFTGCTGKKLVADGHGSIRLVVFDRVPAEWQVGLELPGDGTVVPVAGLGIALGPQWMRCHYRRSSRLRRGGRRSATDRNHVRVRTREALRAARRSRNELPGAGRQEHETHLCAAQPGRRRVAPSNGGSRSGASGRGSGSARADTTIRVVEASEGEGLTHEYTERLRRDAASMRLPYDARIRPDTRPKSRHDRCSTAEHNTRPDSKRTLPENPGNGCGGPRRSRRRPCPSDPRRSVQSPTRGDGGAGDRER